MACVKLVEEDSVMESPKSLTNVSVSVRQSPQSSLLAAVHILQCFVVAKTMLLFQYIPV